MTKTTVVVFTADNARILVNPEDAASYAGLKVITNPDLSAVSGLAPHFWKLEGDKIISMTRPEKLARLEQLKEPVMAAQPKVVVLPPAPIKQREWRRYLPLGWALIGFILGEVCKWPM